MPSVDSLELAVKVKMVIGWIRRFKMSYGDSKLSLSNNGMLKCSSTVNCLRKLQKVSSEVRIISENCT